jgi:glutaminyl-peptide cyclotransferase
VVKKAPRFIPIVVLMVILVGTVQARQDDPLHREVVFMVPEVVAVYPHDVGASTRGLVYNEGALYESTGKDSPSTLRKVDPVTGQVLQSVEVPFPAGGLERLDDTLIVLTDHSQKALTYSLDTLTPGGDFAYQGSGWGLCSDGRYLYMSDGTAFMAVRDRETFEPIFSGLVTVQGKVVDKVGELECVGDYVYAAVLKTNFIIQIDKTNGVVVSVIDTTSLLPDEERAQLTAEQALNGIAYKPDTETFLITGRNWPKLYEVRFVESE